MAIVERCFMVRRLLSIVALFWILPGVAALGQIKLSPGRVPIGDNELNSPTPEPLVTIDELSSNAVMRPTPTWVQQSKDPLVKLVYQTREAQRRRLLSTAEHTPWQIMHGMLALREEFLIRHNGQPVSCMEWIKSGATFENESWFQKTQIRVLTGRGNNAYEMMTVGRGHPYSKPYAFEGHINQFVAIMSMSGVPLETQFQTPQGPVSMRDMLTYAKMTVNEKEEVSWTLWALSRYLPSDAEWINANGEKWSIERLVKIETGKSLVGAPCGGTHGLFALAHARNVYLRTGKPLVGVWLEAEQKIQRYIRTARMMQNSNGTLSSNYFRGREYKKDFDKRMGSSGHLLEFLMMALPSQELNAPWVRRAIEATSNDLMVNRKAFVSCSPLYHATSALSIYVDRVAATAPQIAQAPPKTHSISSNAEVKTVDAALTKPVVENPEAVKTPVMESSGVDSNGAPKALTGPVTTVPDIPEKSAPAPAAPTPVAPTPVAPTPVAPTPAEPTPVAPTPAEPAPAEPAPAAPTPVAPAPVEPAPVAPTPVAPAPAAPAPVEPTPAEPTPAEPAPVAPTPAEPVSESITLPIPMTIPVDPPPAATTDKSPIVIPMATAPAKSTASLVADSQAKVRVFGPKPIVEPVPDPEVKTAEVHDGELDPKGNEIVLNQPPANDVELSIPDAPSSPIPPIPSPGEVAAALAEAAITIEEPAGVPTSTQLATIPNLERTADLPSLDSTPVSSPQSEIPLHNASRPRNIPDASDETPPIPNKGKRPQIWKATPPERRKTIVIEDKTPGA